MKSTEPIKWWGFGGVRISPLRKSGRWYDLSAWRSQGQKHSWLSGSHATLSICRPEWTSVMTTQNGFLLWQKKPRLDLQKSIVTAGYVGPRDNHSVR